MPKLALKVDVNTFRGTRVGVPRLVETMQRHQVQASFFFTLGKDRTGRAIKRIFRSGFLGKASRLSIWGHYGFKTMLYGTLLPSPDIGRKCADIMRSVRDAGFEVGIHSFLHLASGPCHICAGGMILPLDQVIAVDANFKAGIAD